MKPSWEHLWYLVYVAFALIVVTGFMQKQAHGVVGQECPPGQYCTLNWGNATISRVNGERVGPIFHDIKDGVVPWVIDGFHIGHDLSVDVISGFSPIPLPDEAVSVVASIVTGAILFGSVKARMSEAIKAIIIILGGVFLLVLIVPMFVPQMPF